MKLLRVNMNELRVQWGPVPPVYEHLGGRALIAKLLLEEIPPTCDALGPHNKLIFALACRGGHRQRLSIGKPAFGGVRNQCRRHGRRYERKLDLKAIVVEGQPAAGEWYILHVTDDSARLLPVGEVRGLGTYATADKLQERYGADSTVISIGQAGEALLTGASIAVTGDGEQRSNIAARGGLGAVMGSKGLKAIVIDKAEARSVPLANAELFRTAAKQFAQELINDPKLGPKGGTHMYGTASITGAVNEMGSLPTRNFSTGSFEGAADLRGEHMREVILARGGKIGTRCMPGCVIACRNLYVDESGSPIVGTLQYETIALVGANLGLNSLDEVARLNYMCNDFGLDTIETGAALGVAAEAGLAQFGNFESIAGLLGQVGQGTVLGKLIGCGAVATGKVLGVRRVPAALGQA
jgi:aldehyde:ferredoxin oxidoreductase